MARQPSLGQQKSERDTSKTSGFTELSGTGLAWNWSSWAGFLFPQISCWDFKERKEIENRYLITIRQVLVRIIYIWWSLDAISPKRRPVRNMAFVAPSAVSGKQYIQVFRHWTSHVFSVNEATQKRKEKNQLNLRWEVHKTKLMG